jgi:chaperonin GroES
MASETGEGIQGRRDYEPGAGPYEPMAGPLPLEWPAFEPFGDRVLVRQDVVTEAGPQSGRILIPDNQKEQPLEGLVLKAGRGRFEYGVLTLPEARPGDHVLFAKYSGTPIWIDGQEYLLLRDEEIVGRLASVATPRQLELPIADKCAVHAVLLAKDSKPWLGSFSR